MKNTGIKGLMVKDILNLVHYKFSFFVIMIIFIGLAIFNKETLTYLPIMLMAMIGMIGLSTFSYDEVSKADKYLLTLPTNKKELVKSKYILIITMILIGAILAMIITVAVSYLVFHEGLDFKSMITTFIAGIFGISLIECIQIPSVYKWGAEKGRIQMFILILLVSVLIGGAIYLLTRMGFDILLPANQLIQFMENFGIYLVTALICIMYFFSYRLSYKIYEKKEL